MMRSVVGDDDCDDDADVGLMVRSIVGLMGAVVAGSLVSVVVLILQCVVFVVGMGSGVRPWRLPILILLCR